MRFIQVVDLPVRLLTAALLSLLVFSTAPAARAGQAPGSEPVTVDEPSLEPLSTEEVRFMLLDTFDSAEFVLGQMRDGERLISSVRNARRVVDEMDAEQLAGMQAANGAQLALLHESVDQLRLSLMSPAGSGAGGGAGLAKSGGFPVTTFVPIDMILGYDVAGSQETACDDAFDNDGDGRTDCEDPDCNGAMACDGHEPAPVDSSVAGSELFTCSLATPPTVQQLTITFNAASIADIIAAVASGFCGFEILGFNCEPCCIVTDVLAVVLNWIHDSMSLCSGFLTAAQDTAVYGRAGHIHADLETVDAATLRIEGKVEMVQQTSDEILEIVTCKIVPTFRRGHGCDGLDSDCDGSIDNCSEDQFKPVLHVDRAVSQVWYESVAEAVDAVKSATLAFDACQSVTLGQSSSGVCGAVEVVVTATDSCGLETSVTVPVLVDSAAPAVTIPASLAGACFDSVEAAEAAVLAAAALSDDCTPVSALRVRVESTVTDCSLLVRVEATDQAGKRSDDTVTVRVDPRTPVLHLDAAVSLPWHASVADATAAVARAVVVSDDCSDVVVAAPVLSGACGAVSASVTARDACGNETTATTAVRIDGTPPVIVIPPALDGSCHVSVAAAESAVLAAATIADDCTLPGELDVRVDSTVTECALRVRIEAIDRAGHRTVAATTVRVDTALPTVEIERLLLGFRSEVLGFQTPPCFDTVEAAEEAVLAVTRIADNCTAADGLAVAVLSSGDPCSLAVTVSATDGCGVSATDSVTVRVDADPPTVSCTVAEDRLWPANHEMVDVGFRFDATDGCTGDPEVRVRVTSDERTASAPGAGQSSPAPDAEILRGLDGEILGIRLRAERSSSGNGRVYVITVEGMDACGNVASSSCTVSVPSNGHRDAVDDGQVYDATAVN